MSWVWAADKAANSKQRWKTSAGMFLHRNIVQKHFLHRRRFRGNELLMGWEKPGRAGGKGSDEHVGEEVLNFDIT